jgi:hypothetical protein
MRAKAESPISVNGVASPDECRIASLATAKSTIIEARVSATPRGLMDWTWAMSMSPLETISTRRLLNDIGTRIEFTGRSPDKL